MISVPSVRRAEFFGGSPTGLVGRRVNSEKQHGNQVRFGGVFRLAEVKLQEGETLENALRRFKRKVQQEDIIKEVKRHSFYLKPGEKLRAKQALARKRNRKKSRREVE
jgi:small subunit ribosomal protein S21